MSSVDRAVEALKNLAEEQGWDVMQGNGPGCYKWKSPDPTVPMIFTSRCGEHRSLANTTARLRRAGLKMPGELSAKEELDVAGTKVNGTTATRPDVVQMVPVQPPTVPSGITDKGMQFRLFKRCQSLAAGADGAKFREVIELALMLGVTLEDLNEIVSE